MRCYVGVSELLGFLLNVCPLIHCQCVCACVYMCMCDSLDIVYQYTIQYCAEYEYLDAASAVCVGICVRVRLWGYSLTHGYVPVMYVQYRHPMQTAERAWMCEGILMMVMEYVL